MFISESSQYSKQSINSIIIIYLLIKLQMYNHSNLNPLYSFVVVPSPYQFFTVVSISPTPMDSLTPSSEATLNSSSFNSSFIQQFYMNQEAANGIPISSTSLQNPQPIQNSINGERFDHNLLNRIGSSQAISSYSQSNINPSRYSSYNIENSQSLKKQKISNKIKNAQQQDKDYVPKLDRKKQKNVKYFQNQNRNVIPNEVNQIFSFIQKQSKSGYLTERLLNKFAHSPTFTVRRFYLYQKLLKNKLGHYTNQNSLRVVNELYEPRCENWPQQEQRFYNKICRILIRHFLLQDSIFIILTSKRMKSDKKGEHIRARRYVAQAALKILSGC